MGCWRFQSSSKAEKVRSASIFLLQFATILLEFVYKRFLRPPAQEGGFTGYWFFCDGEIYAKPRAEVLSSSFSSPPDLSPTFFEFDARLVMRNPKYSTG